MKYFIDKTRQFCPRDILYFAKKNQAVASFLTDICFMTHAKESISEGSQFGSIVVVVALFEDHNHTGAKKGLLLYIIYNK